MTTGSCSAEEDTGASYCASCWPWFPQSSKGSSNLCGRKEGRVRATSAKSKVYPVPVQNPQKKGPVSVVHSCQDPRNCKVLFCGVLYLTCSGHSQSSGHTVGIFTFSQTRCLLLLSKNGIPVSGKIQSSEFLRLRFCFPFWGKHQESPMSSSCVLSFVV